MKSPGALVTNGQNADGHATPAWPAGGFHRALSRKCRAWFRHVRNRWKRGVACMARRSREYMVLQDPVILKERNRAEDLILGTACGYTVEDIAPFIRSLVSTGYCGRVVLLVDDPWNDTAQYLQDQGVETLQYLPDTTPVTNRRYALYHEFLICQEHLKRVMITDVRDVVFQGNPFGDVHDDRVYCFEEDRGTTLSGCPVNSRWIRQMFGDEALDTVGSLPIICSGITIGGYPSMVRYLDCISRELAARPVVWGGDQAALNMLVYSQKLTGIVIVPNETGPVYTLHHVASEKIRFSSDCRVLNRAGIAAVIHQYDRHPALVAWVRERFFPVPGSPAGSSGST